jgi:hypothetical protein
MKGVKYIVVEEIRSTLYICTKCSKGMIENSRDDCYKTCKFNWARSIMTCPCWKKEQYNRSFFLALCVQYHACTIEQCAQISPGICTLFILNLNDYRSKVRVLSPRSTLTSECDRLLFDQSRPRDPLLSSPHHRHPLPQYRPSSSSQRRQYHSTPQISQV